MASHSIKLFNNYSYIAIVGNSPMKKPIEHKLKQLFPKRILKDTYQGNIVDSQGLAYKNWKNVLFVITHDIQEKHYNNPWFMRVSRPKTLSNQSIGVISFPKNLSIDMKSKIYELLVNDTHSIKNGYYPICYDNDFKPKIHNLDTACSAIINATY